MNVLRTKTSAIEYVAYRIRNLAAQVATRYEDVGVAEISAELIEMATILRLLCMIIERQDTVTIQGDDYLPHQDKGTEDDIPF